MYDDKMVCLIVEEVELLELLCSKYAYKSYSVSQIVRK